MDGGGDNAWGRGIRGGSQAEGGCRKLLSLGGRHQQSSRTLHSCPSQVFFFFFLFSFLSSPDLRRETGAHTHPTSLTLLGLFHPLSLTTRSYEVSRESISGLRVTRCCCCSKSAVGKRKAAMPADEQRL